MPENLFFTRVAIEAFRGFRDRAEFDVGASAVVITGPNGTGKTSFFDAIQWLLLGDLARLANLPHRPKDEYIVNQYRLGASAEVEADISVTQPDGTAGSVTLRRRGRRANSLLEWKDANEELLGEDAERRLRQALVADSTVSLSAALLTSGFLQQDVMREVLEAKETERFQHLNVLLGLDLVMDFEQAAKKVLRERAENAEASFRELSAGRDEIDALSSRIEAVRLRLREAPLVDLARQRVVDSRGLARDFVNIDLEEPLSPDRLGALASSLAAAREAVNSLAASSNRIEARLKQEELPTADTMRSAEDRLASLEENLAGLQSVLLEIRQEEDRLRQRSDRLGELAAAALPLLSERCPVCGQEINPAAVERRLLEGLGVEGELANVGARRSSIEGQIDEAQASLLAARNDIESLRLRLEERQRLEFEIAALRQARESIAEGRFPGVRIPSLAGEEAGAALLSEAAEHLDALQRAIDGLVLALRTGEEAAVERQLASQLNGLRERLRELEERHAGIEANHRRAQQLATASAEASVEITESRFRSLRPLIRDVYGRLDPHPSFKILDLQHDFYRARGATRPVVRDDEEQIEADPMLIFSSSQANIVALSYFLALGWASVDRQLPFLLLDDPLQSMDDVNVLGFADLCRFARRQRQLVISTHERRFASLLERKLASRSPEQRTRVMRFIAWDRRGPIVEAEDVTPQIDAGERRVVLASGP